MQVPKDYQRMTVKLQSLFEKGREIAKSHQNQEFDYLHVFLAILQDSDSVVNDILREFEINLAELETEVEGYLNNDFASAQIEGQEPGSQITENLNNVFHQAEKEAKQLGDKYVSEDTFLLGIVANNKLQITQYLVKAKADYNALTQAVKTLRKGQRITDREVDQTVNVLDKFGHEMVSEYRAMISSGKNIDPITGRNDELRTVEKILGRKNKNNVILVGEAGVGKTAIVEGLAQLIARQENVPPILQDKKIYNIDIANLVANTKVRGEFESRMQSIIKATEQSNGQVILFIDEIHNILGAGKQGDNGLDAGNILKQALSRGKLHLIGATTLNEYKLYLEQDKAFTRRFQRIIVEEPSKETTLNILRGAKPGLERFHHIKIEDAALKAAVNMADKYIKNRFFPDKALDLIDDASAAVAQARNALPKSVAEMVDRQYILQKNIKSLQSDTDIEDNSSDIAKMQQELDELIPQLSKKRAQWQKLYEPEQLKKVENNLSNLNYELLQKKQQGASADQLVPLQKQIKTNRFILENLVVVTPKSIALSASEITGIPVAQLSQSDREKILHLPEALHKRVVGQEDAIQSVSKAIRQAAINLNNPNKPIGGFLFSGPTGTGKTELAKTIAQVMYGSEKNMLRLDMSEYQERSSITKLIGANPGYVGYEEGGILTEYIKNKPASLILLDEIEKANSKVFDLLLQVLDDGRLTDNKGQTVDFTHTIIILTSNMGADEILTEMDANGHITEDTKAVVRAALERIFRPEFVNRLSDIVYFEPINKDMALQITHLFIKKYTKQIQESHPNLQIKLSKGTYNYIADQAKTGESLFSNGARPIETYIRSTIMDAIAQRMLSGEISDTEPQDILVQINDTSAFEHQLQYIVQNGHATEPQDKIINSNTDEKEKSELPSNTAHNQSND